MLFTRTYAHQSALSSEEIKSKLLGGHVKIHDIDFEVLDDYHALTIFPHAEQVVEIKTLPDTHVALQEKDGKTKLVITSRIRQLDVGGVILVLILCGLLIVVSAVLYIAFRDWANHLASFIIFGFSILIYILFRMRLEKGYFDYVKKVRQYVVSQVV